MLAYLNELVPSRRDDDRILWIGAEANTRDPVGVPFFGDGKFAVTKSVPQLDRTIARSGDNLSVIGGEGNR